VDRRYEPYAVDTRAPAGTSLEAAAAGAAHGALLALYPVQKAFLDNALKASLAKLPEGPGKTEGAEFGRGIGDKLVALRKDDGSASDHAYAPLNNPGAWKPTPPTPGPLTIPRR